MAHAFLHSAPKHFKIEVITSAEATRIVFEGKRATGIRYLHDGNTEERIAQARKAVILSSGAIGSPKLMQLSGIGDENGLKDAGVSVHHHLPGVGRNFHDHYTVRVSRRAKAHVKSINELVRGPGLVKEAANWFIGRPSVLALSPVLIYGFCRSDAALDTPDFALSYFPASYKAGQIGYLDDQPGLTCGAFQLRPESRGHVRIVSPDVHDTPEIQPNFLAEHNDRRVIIAGLKCARAVLTSTPMQALIEEELLPGSSVNTDDEWLEYARSNGSTGYHPVGTCKMGPAVNSSSVVSSTLQVHGLESLYVIDASIIPQIPSANTMAATMMIAEKGAEFVLQ